jgi:prepilin-type N-terminal cleavage/methylation domain-containing protein
MSPKKRAPGFTLIELIVAVGLSSIAMMGMFALMTSMVQTEVSAMRGGTVTAWAIANINAMMSDIPAGGFLSSPGTGGAPSPGATSDTLTVCTNWAWGAVIPGAAGVVQASAGNTVYYYCYDTLDAPPYQNALLRKVVTNAAGAAACPAAPACTQANYPSTGLGGGIVATGVYRTDWAGANTQKIFTQDASDLNGKTVDLNFIVGQPNSGAAAAGSAVVGGAYQAHAAVPQTMTFKTKILLED